MGVLREGLYNNDSTHSGWEAARSSGLLCCSANTPTDSGNWILLYSSITLFTSSCNMLLHRELQHVVMRHVLKYILWVMSCYYKDGHTLLVLVCQCTWEGWEVPYPGMDRSRSAGHCRSGRWSRTRAGRRRAPRPCTLPTTAACTERGTRTVPQKRSPAAWRSLGRQNDNINMKSKKRM